MILMKACREGERDNRLALLWFGGQLGVRCFFSYTTQILMLRLMLWCADIFGYAGTGSAGGCGHLLLHDFCSGAGWPVAASRAGTSQLSLT